MAGILGHMKEMAILTNPLVNSYKRLVPGFEATYRDVKNGCEGLLAYIKENHEFTL